MVRILEASPMASQTIRASSHCKTACRHLLSPPAREVAVCDAGPQLAWRQAPYRQCHLTASRV